MLLVLMLTSKGIAGVPRASLVVIAGTLSIFNIPQQGLLLLLGIAGLVLLMNALDACPLAMRYVFILAAALTVGSALHYVYATSGRRAPLP